MSECIDVCLTCGLVLSYVLRGAAPVPEENAAEEPEQSGEQERDTADDYPSEGKLHRTLLDHFVPM